MSHMYDDAVVIPTLKKFVNPEKSIPEKNGTFFSAPDIDLSIYDKFIIFFSSGKDSLASLLHLIDLGVDTSKIELWHHDVDGREGSALLMDWPFMVDYTKKLAQAFNIPIYFSWLRHGFEGEMLKDNSYGHPHHVETPDGVIILDRDLRRSKPSTRLKFPQVSANLQTRWCSSALKIDVGRRALNNQDRLLNLKTLVLSGERREESPNRARYNQFEIHSSDCRNGRKGRYVDSWRPVLHWEEERVWDALKRHGVIAPVPYRLGWGRSSCMKCIFNGPDIWATLNEYYPGSLEQIADYEKKFDTTINRNKIPILDVAAKGNPMLIDDRDAFEQSLKKEYTLPIIDKASSWKLPKGAFDRSGCGPT